MPKKTKTKINKKIVKSIDNDDIIEFDDDEDDIIEFDEEEEDFFESHKFQDINNPIKYNTFDSEKYENRLHKEIVMVPNKLRKTSEVITLFELTNVISNRAKQIENGSMIFTPIGDESDPIKMAEMEIKMKMCPLSIIRKVSSNIAEKWDVNEMIVNWS
jgi:DNA-directed RNA polymerase I, II, and III subunit RPABC2